MGNDAIALYGKLYVALNFLLIPLSHALGDHPVTRTNNLLTRTPPSPQRHVELYGFYTRPAIAGQPAPHRALACTVCHWCHC